MSECKNANCKVEGSKSCELHNENCDCNKPNPVEPQEIYRPSRLPMVGETQPNFPCDLDRVPSKGVKP